MKETLAKILITMVKLGVPGCNSIDLTDPDVVRAYVLVLDERGIIAEDVAKSEAKIMDSQFFPRPFDVAEACMATKNARCGSNISDSERIKIPGRLSVGANGL